MTAFPIPKKEHLYTHDIRLAVDSHIKFFSDMCLLLELTVLN